MSSVHPPPKAFLLTSPVNLRVLLHAALLIEAPPAYLAAVRLLAGVDPLVPLQMAGVLEDLAAVRADEALLEQQPLRRPPPRHVAQVAVRAVARELAAEPVNGRTGEARQGALAHIIGVKADGLVLRSRPPPPAAALLMARLASRLMGSPPGLLLPRFQGRRFDLDLGHVVGQGPLAAGAALTSCGKTATKL